MSQDVLASERAEVADRPPPATGVRVTLFVCSTCRRAGEAEGAPRVGSVLHAATRVAAEAVGGVVVRDVQCLASCSNAPTVAMIRPGGWNYIFGKLDPIADASALVQGALLLRDAPDGVMPWRGRPECLKRNMVGRLPPADLPEEVPA